MPNLLPTRKRTRIIVRRHVMRRLKTTIAMKKKIGIMYVFAFVLFNFLISSTNLLNILINFFPLFSLQYDTTTYDPQQYAINANVLRQPQGLTRSERRAFYESEIKRLTALREKNWIFRTINLQSQNLKNSFHSFYIQLKHKKFIFKI